MQRVRRSNCTRSFLSLPDPWCKSSPTTNPLIRGTRPSEFSSDGRSTSHILSHHSTEYEE
jgi:hypothetical protein